MAAETHYETLGVPADSSVEDIGKAFRKACAACHPDRNPGDKAAEARFKALSAAYHVLVDPEKRARYDLATKVAGAFSKKESHDFQSVMDDIFSSRESRRARADGGAPPDPAEEWRPPVHGLDATVTVHVSFTESFTGCQKHVDVKVSRASEPCPICSGSGGAAGTRRVPCAACGGNGQQVDPRRLKVATCRTCRGKKTVPLHACQQCRGSGMVGLERHLTVTIPKGVHTGTVMRVAGRGGPGSPPGDLFIEVVVDEDPSYSVDGGTLMVRKKVSLRQAILGGVACVSLPDGRSFEVHIPAGTQPGDTVHAPAVTIQGPGVERLGVAVVVDVGLPKRMSPRGAKLLDELCDEISRTEVS